MPVTEALRMFGQVSDQPPVAWAWVESQLEAAETYWVIAPTSTHPHPRPVWGVWLGDAVHLSLGSPLLRAATVPGAPVTVHLDSGLDVVIVEGSARGPTSDREVIAAYDAKYSWTYDLEQYGPFTTVEPSTVLAWRAAGPAGRDGFSQVGRFRF
jgi:hypothetical protein